MEDLIIKIPEELKFVKQTPRINWSMLVSRVINSKLNKMARLQKIISKSKLTERDVDQLSDKINSSLSQVVLHD